jgi:Asp-tRNA(Asn)/Glu-tRNA(Gln) amidotransferase A subunit family amidase
MATPDDLALLDATAQAELVRKKEIQAIELVESAIARIERNFSSSLKPKGPTKMRRDDYR